MSVTARGILGVVGPGSPIQQGTIPCSRRFSAGARRTGFRLSFRRRIVPDLLVEIVSGHFLSPYSWCPVPQSPDTPSPVERAVVRVNESRLRVDQR